jgi:type II secretory pathway pseudopilin PulG
LHVEGRASRYTAGVPLELLAVLIAVAVLLGLAVGTMIRDIGDQRRRERLEAEATLQGRVKAGVKAGAERLGKQAAKATRKGTWWLLKRRLSGERDEG